ncbi:MAG: SOS response-associated peptidase family protein [Planctomycetota bacterium]
MCHHYKAARRLPEHFVAEFSLPTNLQRVFADAAADAYPLKPVGGLRVSSGGELEAFVAEWGLLPRWWKPSDKTPKRAKFQRQTFNARSETAATKPTFRDAMKKRRCLLPFDQFEEKGHYFGIGEPISFAGLWESWRGEDGEVETVTLLTTEPNAEVRGVGHNRMPVLLTTAESRRDWLVEGAEAVELGPFADGVLTVSKAG